MDKSNEIPDSEATKRIMVSLSKAAHTKIKALNKRTEKKWGEVLALQKP